MTTASPAEPGQVRGVLRPAERLVLSALAESGPTARAAGRPAKVLALARPAGLVAALAISRHEVRAGVVGLDGTLRGSAAVPLESLEAPDAVPTALDVLAEAVAAAGPEASRLTAAV